MQLTLLQVHRTFSQAVCFGGRFRAHSLKRLKDSRHIPYLNERAVPFTIVSMPEAQYETIWRQRRGSRLDEIENSGRFAVLTDEEEHGEPSPARTVLLGLTQGLQPTDPKYQELVKIMVLLQPEAFHRFVLDMAELLRVLNKARRDIDKRIQIAFTPSAVCRKRGLSPGSVRGTASEQAVKLLVPDHLPKDWHETDSNTFKQRLRDILWHSLCHTPYPVGTPFPLPSHVVHALTGKNSATAGNLYYFIKAAINELKALGVLNIEYTDNTPQKRYASITVAKPPEEVRAMSGQYTAV